MSILKAEGSTSKKNKKCEHSWLATLVTNGTWGHSENHYHMFTILSLWRQFTVDSRWMYKVNNISFYKHSAFTSYKWWIFLADNCKCPIRFVTMDIYYNKQTISWSYFLIFHSMHCQQARKLCYSWNQITLIAANRGAKQQWIRLNDPELIFLYFIRKDETTLAQRYLSDILFNSIIIISFIIKKPENIFFVFNNRLLWTNILLQWIFWTYFNYARPTFFY